MSTQLAMQRTGEPERLTDEELLILYERQWRPRERRGELETDAWAGSDPDRDMCDIEAIYCHIDAVEGELRELRETARRFGWEATS